VDQTEQFCKQRALYLAISESITRIDKDMQSAQSVPQLLKDALAVGFKTNIGHDYFKDIGARYDLYHQDHTRIPFDIDLLNRITGGGLTPKTLSVIASGTNVGKSLALCHIAASTIAQGKNVLYITMEMAEERIAQRIDANLLDVTMDMLEQMPRKMYEQAFVNLRKHQQFGQLFIKEYPTSIGHAGHFRILLDELALKKGFVPDLLIIDYINICSSVRFKHNGQMNSYMYIKSIAEELRGLAVEYNLPCLSATQFNREGFDSSDPVLTNTSEIYR
jgi:replicative DNA helicase